MSEPPSSPPTTATPVPQAQPALFTPPSHTKVLELPDKLRARAESTAQAIDLTFSDGPSHAALERIAHLRQESHIRIKPGDITHWGTLSVRKRHQRQTDPANGHGARVRGLRPPPRLAISAPAVPKGSSLLSGPVAGSPAGNAWNGQHYWRPQFSDSAPGSPASIQDSSVSQRDPVRRAAYDSVLADVEMATRELRQDAQGNGERLSDADAGVVAAMNVLEEKNAAYELAQCELPLPQDVLARTREFVDAQARALEENSIQDEAELNEAGRWLQIGRDGQLITHVLDYAQANLKMLRERRKSAEMEAFERAYGLVYAVQILEEKLKRMKERVCVPAESSSDDEAIEYGKFLKSLRELDVGLEEQSPAKRVGSEGAAETRRLKGKAPSALDLRTWASEMKRMEPVREGDDGVGGGNMF